jgi:MSHA pilin protein MshD
MSRATKRRRAGVSLIELVVFIVVLGIGIAGTVLLFNQVTRASVDPLIRKQALALASALLEEIELQPFTYCDPDEPAVYTATAATQAQCGNVAGHQESIGAENFGTVESRHSATDRFDNVNDYHNFAMGSGQTDPDIRTADNNTIAALADYAVTVSVANIDNAAELGGTIADTTDALRITVTARHVPSGTTVSLQGYRTRYAPNSP